MHCTVGQCSVHSRVPSVHTTEDAFRHCVLFDIEALANCVAQARVHG